jgi:hypothetical protein
MLRLGIARLSVLKALRLSEADRELLAASLSVSHPAELGALAPRIDPGVTVVVVEQTYALNTKDPAQRVDCAACHRQKNHWRGFVVRLSDGKLATIGRTCGTTKHALEYRAQIAEFTARQRRRRSLEQLIAAFNHYDEFRQTAERCLRTPLLSALHAQRGIFTRTFPALTNELGKNPNGSLYGQVFERDAEAEREREARRVSKLEGLARQWGVEADDPDQQARLLAAFTGDPDFSRERITKKVRKLTGRYQGAAFVCLLSTLQQTIVDLRHRVIHILDAVDDKMTNTLSNSQLMAAVSRFSILVKDLLTWHNTVRDAALFFDPANLNEIGHWIERSHTRLQRIGRVQVSGGIPSVGSAQMPLPDLPVTFPFVADLNRLLADVARRA